MMTKDKLSSCLNKFSPTNCMETGKENLQKWTRMPEGNDCASNSVEGKWVGNPNSQHLRWHTSTKMRC